jgi:hypothetical protein
MTPLALLALLGLLPTLVASLGINLGNVLEAPTEGAWAPAAQEYYFDDYVSRGFTFVRVPVRWDKHMGATPPFAIDPAFLARVHEVTGWALARNLSVLVNSHHDDWIDVADANAFSAALPRFQALWTQVAASFASAPSTLFFEVFNEFHLISLANANAVYASVVPIMRAAGGNNAVRPVYLGGLSWMSPTWITQHPDAIEWPPLADGSRDANLRLEVRTALCSHMRAPFLRRPPNRIRPNCIRPPPAGALVRPIHVLPAGPTDVLVVGNARRRRGRSRHLRERLGMVRLALRPLRAHGRGRLPGRRTLARRPTPLVRDRRRCREIELQRLRSAACDLGRQRDVEDLRPRGAHVGRGRHDGAWPLRPSGRSERSARRAWMDCARRPQC